MPIWESVLVAVENIKAHKLRSFLTIIGIFIGVAAVITVVSIGQAGKTTIVSDIAKYGSGVFFVFPNPSAPNADPESVTLTMGDLDAVKKLEGIQLAAGLRAVMMESQSGKDVVRFNVTGASADYAKLLTMKLEAGRFYNTSEERASQKVVVVESDYAERFFGSPSAAINQRVQMNGKVFRIIGVVKSEKALFSVGGEKMTFTAMLPLSVLESSAEGGSIKLDYLQIKAFAGDAESMKKQTDEVKSLLVKRHKVAAGSYFTQSGEEVQEQVSTIFNILQTIIGSIAGISLLVGGVGVMNIMLVSVTERTREIGIRKAIGATPGMIMTQFMIEAVILSFIGGLLGTLLGLFGAYIFSLVTDWPFLISWGTIGLAFGFSAAVGLFFGLYPANKAARMQPIDSLRYE
jgi:putative ABC transport system permease protein